ncbi:ATP-binding protein [Desulfonispora thiosulfatigenes]|nr:ATP-binding protein [Desulfonispora thiosulfatigenes]
MNECELRIRELHNCFPRLREISEEISKLSMQRIKVGLYEKNYSKAKIIDEQMNQLLEEKTLILKANSISLDIYEPKWNCSTCKDKGYVRPGVLCDCYKQEHFDQLFFKSGIKGNMQVQTFDNFKLSYYKDPIAMSKKIERCKDFVRKIVAKEGQNNLFFTGDVGRGKTHLSVAIANLAMNQRKTVIYKRIDDLLDIIREYKYQRDGGSLECNKQLEYLKEVDLLVIDDLGTESLTPFAETQIRMLIEDRNILDKPWIINSNLSIKNLQVKYGARITDRIIEKADIFYFESEMSIRELKRSRQISEKK